MSWKQDLVSVIWMYLNADVSVPELCDAHIIKVGDILTTFISLGDIRENIIIPRYLT
jgi:hypothetical protein